MDLDLLDSLPPPTISLASTRSWSMTKFIDFPEDLPTGEDHHRSQGDIYRYPEESRFLSMAPTSRGILIQGSGEYVQPQDVWASSISKRFGAADGHYYHISTDSTSTITTTPSPTSTTGHTFLSGDAHNAIENSLDSGPSSMTSPTSDSSDSSGHSVYSTSEGHSVSLQTLSVPSFSPSLIAQSGSHSPLSIYSPASTSPLALSAISSPQAPYQPVPDRMLSPLQLARPDAGTTVNMSDVYSNPSAFDDHVQDIYALTLTHSFSDFDEPRAQGYSPPLHSTASYEAELESEFGYRSPFRALDVELPPSIGKRARTSGDFGDDFGDRKRARQNSPVVAAKKRGRPRKSEQAMMTPFGVAASPPRAFVESDEDYQEADEDDSDSDAYVPSDEEGAHRRRARGRKGSSASLKSGNAEALRELELRTNGDQDFTRTDGYDYSGLTDVGEPRESVFARRQNGKRTQPVPVPNLTKKSRGRKVPVSREDNDVASSSLVYHPFDLGSTGMDFSADPVTTRGRPGKPYGQGSYDQPELLPAGIAPNEPFKVVSGGIKKLSGERRYVCTVEGCGKCFVRGEHLKRHVRSLHTWEKPHKCPHPGCGKSFSRRDNLGQHVRVHF